MNKFLLALALAAAIGNIIGMKIESEYVNTPNHAALAQLVEIEAR